MGVCGTNLLDVTQSVIVILCMVMIRCALLRDDAATMFMERKALNILD